MTAPSDRRGSIGGSAGEPAATPVARGAGGLSRLVGLFPWLAIAAIAGAVGVRVVGSLGAGQVGYDTVASAIYFDRIVAGHRLEAFVATTPKALITLWAGGLMAVFGDWRVVSVTAMGLFGLNVAAGAALAKRLAGPVAGGFAAVALIGSVPLLEDASAAYGIGPAVFCWLTAGLLLTQPRPRFVLAGIAIMLAGLARLESLVLVAAVVLAFAAGAVPAIRARFGAPPRAAAWLLVGALAVPVQMVHDGLLTGDPLWFLKLAAMVSEGQVVRTPGEVAGMIGSSVVGIGIASAFAALGVIGLWRRRSWCVLLGLAAITIGVAAFLEYLAIRGVWASARYTYPITLAITFAASLGAAELDVPRIAGPLRDAARRFGERRSASLWAVVVFLGGALLAFGTMAGWAPLNADLVHKIDGNAKLFRNERAAVTALRGALRGTALAPITNRDPLLHTDPQSALVLSPILLVPRLAADLHLPLTEVAALPAPLPLDGSVPRPGQIVYLDDVLSATPPDPLLAPFKQTAPANVNGMAVVPVYTDAAHGIWVERIGRP